MSDASPRIVGSLLVRNEDVFVERALRNVAAFCDRIHVLDHMSSDRTWEILVGLAAELDHVELVRSKDTGDAHRVLEPYAGTPTWVIGVDGDELYDPTGLARLRGELVAGAHDDVFRIKAHVLNCVSIDDGAGTATGYMAPPSRPVTKLFNFAALQEWPGARERLQGGSPAFRAGYDWELRRFLSEDHDWDSDPLRLLHTCFMRRSSRDPVGAGPRTNLPESLAYRRDVVGTARRLAARVVRRRRLQPAQAWKRDWYALGDQVTVDVRPFAVAGAT
jgi:hypothetical protein